MVVLLIANTTADFWLNYKVLLGRSQKWKLLNDKSIGQEACVQITVFALNKVTQKHAILDNNHVFLCHLAFCLWCI